MKTIRLSKVLLFSVFILFLFAGYTYPAVMPDYVRLQPVTANLNAPTAITLDSHENVYVTESSNNRLLVYTQSGNFITSLAGLSKPLCVAVDTNGRIFIGNKDRRNVEVYSANLSLLFKLGSGDGEFSQPNDIEIDSSGKIYVIDKMLETVKVYNANGSFMFSFGSSGNGNGEFHSPTSIEIDEASGEIIVLDHQLARDSYGGMVDGARIQLFDMNGYYKSGFSKYGQNVGLMYRPQHVAIDEAGRIFVTDSYQNVVLVYDRVGTYLGAVYDLTSPLRTPLGITIGRSNRLFVASLMGPRVDVFGVYPYTQLQVTPLSLSFNGLKNGGNPLPQTVSVTNTGSDQLNWTADTPDGWITLSETSGSLLATEAIPVDVGVNLSGLTTGSYAGTVNVRAEAGGVETIYVLLSVLNAPPQAVPGGPYTGVEGQALTLDGSSSKEGINYYEWDVNSDGVNEYSSLLATQSHIYTQQGAYYIRLRVTNTSGASDEAFTEAIISDSLPDSVFTGSPGYGSAPLTVSFFNNSTGNDQPLSYEWDFDNDGIIDSAAQDAVFTYTGSGVYTVTLTVTDSDSSVTALTMTDYITVCDMPVKLGSSIPVYYPDIQSAYNAAVDGDAIRSQDMLFSGTVVLDQNKSVTIEGSYNCDFTSQGRPTTLYGDIIISNGTITVGNIVLSSQ